MADTMLTDWYIAILVIFLTGLFLGIWALMKTASTGRHYVMPWWGHMLMMLFLTPISIITSVIELYKQYTHAPGAQVTPVETKVENSPRTNERRSSKRNK